MVKKLFILSMTLLIWKINAQNSNKNQTPKPAEDLNWYLKDPRTEKVFGVGAEKAYQLLNEKKPKDVIVAVIDSGVEIDHPDLKDVIWVNEDEIPNNGIDDDKNGYIDDIHGWSFLGGSSDDIDKEALELARICRNEDKYFRGKDLNSLNDLEKIRYDKFIKYKNDLAKEKTKNQQQYQGVVLLSNYIDNVKAVSNGVFSKKTNKAYIPKDEMETKIKKRIGTIMMVYPPDKLDKELNSAKETFANLMKMNSIDADSIRRVIVGDNPNDMTERFYGCNRYEGPDASHGTHVSGIIAAKRGNGIGIDGIAVNAKIMVIRAVPNGDERDKDVANAIRYAVDNGAKIINMSFGKYVTSNKEVVDEAIKYAKSKDVLLVHAAGNDAKNKDIEESYPTRVLSDGTIANNWLEVGASSCKKKSKLIGDFSNYGSKTVDIFAPGVDIYSTVPNGTYEDNSGTSMACPAATGVAAIIRGYFPELSAAQVKEVLMKTVIPFSKPISIPGKSGKEAIGTMKDVSVSAGFINAASAVEYLIKK
jgi:subtilisin family serine protease